MADARLAESCFQRAKVQDLDAIHNANERHKVGVQVVFKEQKYKI